MANMAGRFLLRNSSPEDSAIKILKMGPMQRQIVYKQMV
jgi:hypothetical protein